jgi:hypothetical protein
MCIGAPKAPTIPPGVERQAMQVPKDASSPNNRALAQRRRRGLWASIFTSPQGVTGTPTVTGTSGGITGG